MNKLQLYINMSQSDFQTMVEINPDSYVKSWVCDLRQTVSQVDYDANGKSIFYMLKYIDNGVFIVVLRTIPKVHGNHLASWIFIPYSLRISDRDVEDIVTFITVKVGNSEIKQKDISEMRELFSHDYEEDILAPVFPPCEGLTYGYRYYGPRTGVSLSDLLGQFRYQTSYLHFAGMMLINQDITSDTAGTNLTSAPLDSMAVLLPPANQAEGSYHPTIYGQDFDIPYYVPMSRNIDIIWRNDNGSDVKQTIYVAQSEMRAPNLTNQNTVHHLAEGYAGAPNHPFAPIDRTAGSDLPQRKKTYNFQIPSKSAAIGTVIEFEITTNADLEGSPIDGYYVKGELQEGAGRNNRLIYRGDSSRKKPLLTNLIYAAGGLIVGILSTMLFTCGSDKSQTQGGTPAPQAGTELAAAAPKQAEAPAPVEQEAPKAQESEPAKSAEPLAEQPQNANPAVSLEAAIKYLDTHQIWNKEEMEAFPDLQGLYDDMNNIDRHRLVEHWGPKLKESRTFSSLIVKHSKLSYKKKPRRNPFNKESDTSIRIQTYQNTIDP